MKRSLQGRLAALLLTLLLIAATAGSVLTQIGGSASLATLLVMAVGVFPILWLSRRLVKPLHRLLRALSGAIASYRDGDFTFSLVVDRKDELGELIAAHNELGRALREQHAQLVQRELLLDTITQNSPVALVLVDPHQRVAYANLAARHLLSEGSSLTGHDFKVVLHKMPEEFGLAALAVGDCLFAAEINGNSEMFHLSKRSFLLQGRSHRLYLFKCLTRELSRQEVATWKKLIRVLSHELNNSLAPITSLAQSGLEIVRSGETSELIEVLSAIGERAEHLHRFIQSYATLAKLPAPRREWVEWHALIQDLRLHQRYHLAGDLPVHPGWFDRAQIEQSLINLLKNAHEAGGPPEEIKLIVVQSTTESRIEVRDRGPGMSPVVMSQALLPFYSTKRTGTGLGLALVREIAEAHGGRLALANTEEGGFSAMLILPLSST